MDVQREGLPKISVGLSSSDQTCTLIPYFRYFLRYGKQLRGTPIPMLEFDYIELQLGVGLKRPTDHEFTPICDLKIYIKFI